MRLKRAVALMLVVLAAVACEARGTPSRDELVDRYIAGLRKEDVAAIKKLVNPALEPDAEIARRIESHGGPEWRVTDRKIVEGVSPDLYRVVLTFRSTKDGTTVTDEFSLIDIEVDAGGEHDWFISLGTTGEDMPQPLDVNGSSTTSTTAAP
jgi:hypothetical protein